MEDLYDITWPDLTMSESVVMVRKLYIVQGAVRGSKYSNYTAVETLVFDATRFFAVFCFRISYKDKPGSKIFWW